MKATRPRNWTMRGVWSLVVVLAVIGLMAVVRQGLYLAEVLEPLEARFAEYSDLTWLHIIPGFLFMVLGPLQFVERIRSRFLWLHRWSGRLFVASSVVIGVTALVMGVVMPAGGVSETAATTFFAILFLFALGKAFLHIRRRELSRHRAWMIRTFAIGLAVATARPIVGMFFIFSDLSFQEFFGAALWLSFTLHLVLAEVWLNYSGSIMPDRAALPGTAGKPGEIGETGL